MVMFLHHRSLSLRGLLLRREDEIPLTKEVVKLICLTLLLEGQPLARERCRAKGQQPGLRPQVLPPSQSTYAASIRSTERSVQSSPWDPAATRTARSSSATITCTCADLAPRAPFALSMQLVKLMIALEMFLDPTMSIYEHCKKGMRKGKHSRPVLRWKSTVQGRRRGGR